MKFMHGLHEVPNGKHFATWLGLCPNFKKTSVHVSVGGVHRRAQELVYELKKIEVPKVEVAASSESA